MREKPESRLQGEIYNGENTMSIKQTEARIQDTFLRRLSSFDTADFGPHATALYQELGGTAAAGLPLATIILSASIVDVVHHEEAGPAGFMDGAAFSYAGNKANLGWLRRRRNHLVHHEGPIDGLMGEADALSWLASDAERAVMTLLDFLDDLRLSD